MDSKTSILTRTLRKLYFFGIKYPKSILLSSLVVLLLLGFQLPSLRSTISLHDIVDPSLPGAKRLEVMKDHFEHGNGLFISFNRVGGLRIPDVTKIKKWINNLEHNYPEVIQVNSPFSIRIGEREGNDRLWFHKLIAKDDPTELKKIRGTPWEKLVTSKSFDDIGVEVILRDTPGGSRYGRFDPKPVREIIEALELLFPENLGLEFNVVGNASFSNEVLKGIRFNSRLNLLTLIAIILFLKFFYGSFKGGFLLGINLLFSGVFAFGTMSLFNIPIDILNSGIFMMLSVAGLEDFIFLSNLRQKYGDRDWKRPFEEILVPSFFTSLTTVIGFGSLYFSDILIIQKFGLIAALGAIIEWVSMFIITPALLQTFPGLRDWTGKKERRFNFFTRLSKFQLSRFGARALLLLFLFVPYALLNLNTVDSPLNLFPKDNPFHKATKYLERSRDWQGELSIVFTDDSREHLNRSIVNQIEKLHFVTKIDGPYIQRDFWTKGFDPLTQGLIVRSLKSTTMYKRIFSKNEPEARAIVYTKSSYTDDLKLLISEISTLCKDGKFCYPAGELVSYSEFSDRVLGALFRSLGSSLLLVGAVIFIISLRFGHARKTPLIMLSCFWGVGFMLVLVSLLQVRVNFMTCVFASVLVGLTGDNGIQFLFSGKSSLRDGIERHAPASIAIAIIMSITCLLFISAAFVPPRIFGILLSIGIISSLVGDIWMMKALSEKNDGR